MTPKQSRAASFAASLLVALFATLSLATPAAAQDVITVGTVTASGNTVDVPVYVRDVSGTPLGIDRPAGSRIQGISLRVTFPAAAISSVTFDRAGIIPPPPAGFSSSNSSTGAVFLFMQFSESSNLLPFTSNAAFPGDQVAHLTFTLSGSVAPGGSIPLTLDDTNALTQLSNQGGTATETTQNGQLAIVGGSINIPQPSLAILPSSTTVFVNDVGSLLAQASVNLGSSTTVTLTSSNPAAATVPGSVVIPAGSRAVEFTVTGIAVGTTTITAALPQSIGGATATSFVSVTDAPIPCDTPAVPQLSAPVSAEVGKAYAVSWTAVAKATDYVIDESTSSAFATLTSTQTVITTSASFTHSAANRYYYRIRARNTASGCNTTSASSSAISVLVSVTPVPQTRFLPVVGSTPGNNGAYFKTAVQLFNPKSTTVTGKIVFHPQNASGTSSDPSIVYAIAPGKSVLYTDLLPAMGVASGIGSTDVVADAGSPFPIALVRVFNDAGAAGTTGLTEEVVTAADALQTGDTAALIAPADVQRFRLNIGIRTLDLGVSMTLTVRDKAGVVVKTVTKSYGPNFFIQPGSAAMLDGYALAGEETISIAITSGSAFIYGSTTDNTTQDPSVQFAKRIE